MTAQPPAFPSPAPPYLGPAAHDGGTGNRPIYRVVIHMTVSPCEPGQARVIAAWFRNPKAQGSAHYVVDPDEEVQVVFDSVVAFHAPPNAHSLGIEMCGFPETNAVKAWANWNLNRNYRRTLRRAARLTARLLLAEGLPAHFLQVGFSLTDEGVTTHNNVSQTFHQSVHWDPGVWPKRRFMRQVRRHMRRLRKGVS